jgi:hypothetical protein
VKPSLLPPPDPRFESLLYPDGRPSEMRARLRVSALVLALFGGLGVAVMWLRPAEALGQSAPTLTRETLVDTTSTTLPAYGGRKAVEVQNLGPNPIWCSVGATLPVAHKAREIAANGGTWSLDVSAAMPIRCITASAKQVTGAATITTEI